MFFRLHAAICLVMAAPVTAANLTRITDDSTRDWDPSWSPDGTMLVFTSGRSGTDQLWLIPAEGGRPDQLTDDSTYCMHPAWSPNGKFIAFLSERSGNQDIWTIRPDGRGLKRITTDPSRDESLGWLRKRIVFDSDRTGDWEIWSAPQKGGAATRITESPGVDAGPEGSHDGTRIAFSSNRAGDTDLWLMSAAGGEATRLTSAQGRDVGPVWSPDDSVIAFASERSGNWDIWAVQARGGRPWPLTTSPGIDLYPAWSPNGAKMAISSDRAGNEDLWILDLVSAIGCLELGGKPLTEAQLLLAQTGRPKRKLESSRDGCFMFPALRERKTFKLKIGGPEVTAEGTDLIACFNLNDDPLLRAKVSLKQPGRGAQSQRTGTDGCVLFEDLTPGTPFKMTLKGPKVS